MTTYDIRDVKAATEQSKKPLPSREQAEEAVRTLIAWIGENPMREGLLRTPRRVIDAYSDFFSGYQQDLESLFSNSFENINDYDDIVLLRDIILESHCEHHMVPFHGVAHVAYIPDKKIIGISKIARVVDLYARRLQTQENLTQQIKKAFDQYLQPKGVAVMIIAQHECMTTRGVHKKDVETITCALSGLFREDKKLEERFLNMIKK